MRAVTLIATLLAFHGTMFAGGHTIEAVAERFQQNTITGVTVVVHGFQLAKEGDSLRPLAADIFQAVPATWLLDYDVNGGDGGTPVFDADGPSGSINVPTAASPPASGHLVLLFDWAADSNEASDGWGEAAGDALFALLAQLGAIDPARMAAPPIHMIGHSFGAAVISRAAEQMAAYGLPVAQLTYLDPHDFDQSNVPTYDDAQALYTLGLPEGYGASAWETVEYVDVYYQTRGARGLFTSVQPNGRPIPGAHNVLMGAALLPPANSYPLFAASGDHSYVWDCFYRATVTGQLPGGCTPPVGPLPSNYYGTTGWNVSPVSGAGLPTGRENFYAAGQDHEFSLPLLVDTVSGAPNLAGLAELGLSVEDVTHARWAPQWNPRHPANFDFESGPEQSDVSPGWSNHGGGGSAPVLTLDGRRVLALQPGAPQRTHNRTYIPHDADRLLVTLRRVVASADDELRISIGSQPVGVLPLSLTDAFYTQRAWTLPPEATGQAATIQLAIHSPVGAITAEVRIDSVRFGGCCIEAQTTREAAWPVGAP